MRRITGRQKMIAASLGVAIIVLAMFLFLLPKGNAEEAYRSIRIVELEGAVTIERENTGNLEAAVNMNLMSGDYVSTGAGAYIVLRLDADKYVMLGESGAMEVVAEGSGTTGRTSIHLASGSVLSEIRNPLGEDSTFDIVTPNATMSVRGTVFEVSRQESGMRVLVYDGKVAVGLAGKEPVLYEAGEYTEFTDEEMPQFLIERETITEEQMDEQILQRLQQIQADGRRVNLGTVQISKTNEKEPETTPVPEPTVVPETITTPEVVSTPEVTAEPTIAPTPEPTPVATPKATPTPRPATGPVPAWTPRVTATPAPPTQTPEPEDIEEPEEDDEPEEPAPEPTEEPTPEPTEEPVPEPTEEPVPEPTEEPTPEPTEEPTPEPTEEPVPEPEPTEEPVPEPTEEPAPEPELTEDPASESGSAEEPTQEPEESEEPSLKEESTWPPAFSARPERPSMPVPTVPPREPTPKPDEAEGTPQPNEIPSVTSQPNEMPDDKTELTVTYCLPYVALSYSENGVVYTDMRDVAVYSYGTYHAVSGTALKKRWPPSILSTPLGYEWGKLGFICTGWCTEDGGEWDFDKDTVKKDMTLYPIWVDSKGQKYYPVIYEAPETGFRICNNVIAEAMDQEQSSNMSFDEPMREGYVLGGWKKVSQQGSLLTRFQAVWEK